MVPTPIALGLTICDYVIVEEKTRKVSLIGGFTAMRVERFPILAPPFSVFAVVTDGLGNGTIQLTVLQEDTLEEITAREMSHQFPDRLAEVKVHFRLRQCVFPVPGWYQFTLLVDGEWVAQRRVRVYREEETS